MDSSFARIVFFLKRLNEKIELFFTHLYQSLISCIKVIVLSKFNTRIPSTQKEECLILGNGPSLKEILVSKKNLLLTKELFCVNNFPSTEIYEDLKPKNLVFLDNAFFAKKEYRIPVVKNTIEALLQKTNWKLNLYIPVFAKNSRGLIQELKSNPNIEIHYFNYTIVKGFNFFTNFLYKNNLGMPLCQNVLGASIFIALNMGYKKVVLLGADHSWIKDVFVGEDNLLYVKHTHFYSDINKPPVTRLDNPSNENLTVSAFLLSCKKAFDTYYILEDYSDSLDAKILNATDGSYIDAFDRVEFK